MGPGTLVTLFIGICLGAGIFAIGLSFHVLTDAAMNAILERLHVPENIRYKDGELQR